MLQKDPSIVRFRGARPARVDLHLVPAQARVLPDAHWNFVDAVLVTIAKSRYTTTVIYSKCNQDRVLQSFQTNPHIDMQNDAQLHELKVQGTASTGDSKSVNAACSLNRLQSELRIRMISPSTPTFCRSTTWASEN